MKNLGYIVLIIVVIVVLALIIPGDQDGENGQIDGNTNGENQVGDQTNQNAAEESVLRDLKNSGLVEPGASVEIVSSQERTWEDACLGIDNPDQVCAQVLTPGFEIILETDTAAFTYRTDGDGNLVILESQENFEFEE